MDAKFLFLLFLILGAVLLFLDVLLFFLFDIRQIIMIKTGKGVRKTNKRMKAENSGTGKLRNAYMISEVTDQLPDKKSAGKKAGSVQRSGRLGRQTPAETPVQPADTSSSDGTSVLGVAETTVESDPGTTVLDRREGDAGNNSAGNTYNYVRKTAGKFVITYDLKLINSNEDI